MRVLADTPVNGPRDIQCLQYDYLRRMTDAFSTDSTGANPCATGTAGGPAAYHQSWTYDETGNRKTETLYGIGTANTTRTYSYPGQGQGQNQPHTITRIDESGPAGNRTYNYDYDDAGNTTDRPNQTLTWDAEDHLASATPTGGQATTFVYDANGDRLVRKEPGATTLYLPGMELRLDTATRAVTATRYYTLAGKTVAVRNTTGVYFQAADHHDTAVATINAVTGAIVHRRSTPFGAPRGAAPSYWPDQKGFVGGTQDAGGLTHLGAREYDPLIGRFISVDPIIDIYDPQQMHGYAYSNSNPMSFSDPDGKLLVADSGGSGSRPSHYNDGNYPQLVETKTSALSVLWQVKNSESWSKADWWKDRFADGLGGLNTTYDYLRGQPARYAGSNPFRRITNLWERGNFRFTNFFVNKLGPPTAGFSNFLQTYVARATNGLTRTLGPSLAAGAGNAAKAVGAFARSGFFKIGGPIANVALAGFDAWSEIQEGKDPVEAVTVAVCTGVGSAVGGAVGAAVGTAVCGGLPVCGFVGGALGGMAGGAAGESFGNKIAPAVSQIIKDPGATVKKLCFWCK